MKWVGELSRGQMMWSGVQESGFLSKGVSSQPVTVFNKALT